MHVPDSAICACMLASSVYHINTCACAYVQPRAPARVTYMHTADYNASVVFVNEHRAVKFVPLRVALFSYSHLRAARVREHKDMLMHHAHHFEPKVKYDNKNSSHLHICTHKCAYRALCIKRRITDQLRAYSYAYVRAGSRRICDTRKV